jgi:FK506-binding nuclear protein
MDDGQAQLYGDEDEDDYDLSPDEDELDALEDMEDDEESDELDDLADPRLMEVDTDEEKEAPKLVKPAEKGKNKRPAEDSDEEDANLDDIMAKSIKPSEPTTNGEEKPLSKAQKKKVKKMKKNDGEAAPVETTTAAGAKQASKNESKSPEALKKEAATNGEKKVQFAKNLEQGPTPSATPPSNQGTKETTKPSALGVKDVQGVTVDDRKLGTGPQAKKGSRIEMRYIGKLENGKVFDG